MWYSYEGPRVFWLSPGETSTQARDPFISVRIRSQVGTSRHILRLPVGKDVTVRQDHSCFRTWSCTIATHSSSAIFGLPRLSHHQSEAEEKTNRENFTTAVTDLHSSTNQAPVANHNRATLLRERYFSCKFACSGSFQLPCVRHATPITRPTRFLTEVGRRDASLICSHA